MIDNAAIWLRSKGTTQWQRPWPNREERDGRVRDALELGQTWLLRNKDAPIATVTFTRTPNAALWSPRQRKKPALYLHRLVVDRGHAGLGLGAHLLNWAGLRARNEYGARWIRIDVWTDNFALHRYYLDQGFRRLRLVPAVDDYPASARFQKKIAQIRPDQPFPFEVGAPVIPSGAPFAETGVVRAAGGSAP